MTDLEVDAPVGHLSPRRIHVVATTPDNARRALAVAVPMTGDSEDVTTVVIDHAIDADAVVSDRPGTWGEVVALEYRQVVRDLGAAVEIETHPFRSMTELLSAIPVGEIVVISGPSCPWTPSREEELANQLLDHGRRAVFVACLRVEECGRPTSIGRLDERAE